MIRYRIYFLLFCTNVLLTATENAPKIVDDKKTNTKPPDKLLLRKSKSYSEENSLVDTISNWIKDPFTSDSSEENKNEEDLTAAASEHISARYLSSRADYGHHSRNCYECNSEPWIPIVGRSLNLPASSSHFNSLEDHALHISQPHFNEKQHINKQYNLNHPPIDQYGAPQATYDYPRAGEVVDFMLPPPTRTHNFLSNVDGLYGAPPQTYGAPNLVYGQPNPPQPLYRPPNPPQSLYSPPKPFYNLPNKNGQNIFDLSPPLPQNRPPLPHRVPLASNIPSFNYGPPSNDISPPPPANYGTPPRNYGTSLNNYGPPGIPINNNRFPSGRNNIPKTYLRPVSQDFQPPLPVPGVQNLPLENINPPPPLPSDSYGKPLATAFSNAQFHNNYGAPMIRDQQQHVEPITLGSGDSDEFDGPQNYFSSFEAQQNEQLKASFYQKGLTDVQVVPSIKIADYTASIEHPINIIQSPILDLNINDQNGHQGSASDNEISNENTHIKAKLSENPIFVDDTYTSASNINTTYFANSNSTASKRHNDKYISNEHFKSYQDTLKEDDLTTNLIKNLILDNNLIKDPQTQIIGIQKAIINPKNFKTKLETVKPLTDYSSWSFSDQNQVSTVMVPPKPSTNTWLSPVNESFVAPKTSKKLQIIVPYIKSADNHMQWKDSFQKSTAIYNREYSTLAPVFVPPPMSTESSNDMWTKFVEDIRAAETHRDQAHGFGQSSSTQVYNIKDFIARQQNKGMSKLPYDVISLQKNIDDWTHQSYANRISFGDKLPPKQAHAKIIPQEYFTTTPSYSDNTISSELRGDIPGQYDHVASSSNNKNYISGEIEDNSILTEVTDGRSSTEKLLNSTTVDSVKYIVKKPEPSWKQDEVVISNSTHEKVYVVTPQSYTYFPTSTPATAFSMAPRIQNGKVNNMPYMTRISVRVEAPSEKDRGKALKPVKVVYSEWPHLINNLATTTHRPTSRHPLFGLMDLSAYTPPPNSTVETIGGHSKVTSVVTTPINKYSSTSPAPSTNSHETAKVPPAAQR